MYEDPNDELERIQKIEFYSMLTEYYTNLDIFHKCKYFWEVFVAGIVVALSFMVMVKVFLFM
jgi:hypothetical protein